MTSLYCFVDKDGEILKVKVQIGDDIMDLKMSIHDEGISKVPSRHLVLWKLHNPLVIAPANTLASRIKQLGYEYATFADELKEPTDQLSEWFTDVILNDHLYIIVQVPASISPSSSKYSKLSAQSMPRKLKRRRVEDDGAEETQIGDALNVDAHPRLSWPRTRIDQIKLIHDAIRALPENIDFSNPTMFTTLPFPSPLEIPFQRFEWRNIDNVAGFSYMGRLKFAELYKLMQGSNFLAGYEKIYLHGTSGSGKSHILAALVCRLICERKRVVYIPDCSLLLADFTLVIRSALRFAFYDSEPHLTFLESADKEDLFTFCAGQTDVYFVVDQLNALELGGRNAYLDDVKKDVMGYLLKMKLGHKYIFSASASEQSNREYDLKQSGITVIPINGGLTEEETAQWFNHHATRLPVLSNEDRRLVVYLTGRIPLLLRGLFENKNFDYNHFMIHKDLLKVHQDVSDFFLKSQEDLNKDPAKKDIYFATMDACLQSRRSWNDVPELRDLRYSYIDADNIGHFTCGVAFETMMLLFQRHRRLLSQFCDQEWYSAVERSSLNPFVQGFLAEHICLSQIATSGLLAVNPCLTQMSHTYFEARPNWSDQLNSTQMVTVRLYIPTAYNFKAVDAAILYRAAKTIHIYLIQITLNMRHKLSEDVFYRDVWKDWVTPIEEMGYSVEFSTFVWIDKKKPANDIIPESVKILRSGKKIEQPEHTSIHIGIEQVDPRLARVLGLFSS